MPSRPDLADAMLAYDFFWLELVAPRKDDEGEAYYAPFEELRDGAFALLRHARGLEDYFAGRWELPVAASVQSPESVAGKVVPVVSRVDAVLEKALSSLWVPPPPLSSIPCPF